MDLETTEKSILQERKSFAVFLFVGLAAFGGYDFYLDSKVRDEGVYVKAEVVASKGYKGSVMTTIRYRFKGQEYSGRVNSPNGKEEVGTIYFLKLLPYDPEVVTLLDDQPVPECLLTTEAPFEGWKEIPKCK